MKTFLSLTKRNIKIFFKDKGMFFTSLLTPLILLVLYATFLGKIYKDTFLSYVPDYIPVPSKLISGAVAGQLVASLLSVSAVTVAFCSNMLCVQDKINGAARDFAVTPVKGSVVAVSYYVSTLLATLIVSYVAMGTGFIYMACQGWYMSFTDVVLLMADILLVAMFGTALSSVINVFLNTQGQMSAVGTIVSAGYGFLCGAYMPISQYGDGLRKVLSLLPGTYGTSLIKNHTMNGVFEEMASEGFPPEAVEGIKNGVDCHIDFFGSSVEIWVMYVVMIIAIAVLLGAFILVNNLNKKN